MELEQDVSTRQLSTSGREELKWIEIYKQILWKDERDRTFLENRSVYKTQFRHTLVLKCQKILFNPFEMDTKL